MDYSEDVIFCILAFPFLLQFIIDIITRKPRK